MIIIKIINWYGYEQEINPALFVNEEYHYPQAPRNRSGMVKNRDIIQYCGYDDIHEFWSADDGPAHYLYHRVVAEAESYLGWRLNNGYHIKTKQLSDIEKALNHYTTLKTKIFSSDIKTYQLIDLACLIFDVDQSFFLTNKMPRSSVYKTVLFIYAFCVQNQPPQVALEAARDSDALFYLKKDSDIIENSLWIKCLNERIQEERKKLKLN